MEGDLLDSGGGQGGGLRPGGQGQDHQKEGAEQIEDKRIDDDHPQAQNRAEFMIRQHRTNAKIHIVGKPFSKKQ